MLISELLNQELASKTKEVVSCNADETVAQAVARMTDNNIGSVVVLRGDSVVGIFTERDVLRGLHQNGGSFLDDRLEDRMITKVVVINPSQTIDEALQIMNEYRIRHLPVVDEKQVVSVLSVRDLVAQKLDRVKHTAEFLQQQVQLGSKPLPM